MKKPVAALSLLLPLLTVSPARGFASDAGDSRRLLPVEIAAFDGDLMALPQWDMSQRWVVDDRRNTTVTVYGDTLLAETVSGRRTWYEIRRDSLFFKGEEDRLSAIGVDSTVFVGFYPLRSGDSRNSSFTAGGTVGGRGFSVIESGVLSIRTTGKPRLLILSDGDTIRNAILTKESRVYTAAFAGDTVHAPQPCAVETYRWYDADEERPLPVAIQKIVSLGDNIAERAQPAVSSLFIRDRLDIDSGQKGVDVNDRASPDAEQLIDELHAAEVTVNGRRLDVTVGLSVPGLALCVDVMDTAGRLYLHGDFTTSGGRQTCTLDCAELRSGEYIVAINLDAAEPLTEKRYVKIR